MLLYDGGMPNAPRRARASDAPTEVTAAPVESRPDRIWLVALGIMAVGAIVGLLFLHYRNPPPWVGIAAFATVYVLAQAIERVLEVLSRFLGLGRGHDERVAMCFGLASALAMAACGYFGIGILHAIGDDGSPRYTDVIVTGLAVGGATKPLHDLITILESAARTRKATP